MNKQYILEKLEQNMGIRGFLYQLKIGRLFDLQLHNSSSSGPMVETSKFSLHLNYLIASGQLITRKIT